MSAAAPGPARLTSQRLLPAQRPPIPAGRYDLYPAQTLPAGQIGRGFDHLAARLAGARRAVIDGYGDVGWAQLRAGLEAAFGRLGVRVRWHPVAPALRPPAELEALITPFLGGADPLFGTRFTGALADFFDPARLQRLQALRPDGEAALDLMYGCGAALAGWPDAQLVYVDVPKNELQFRARAGALCNLGRSAPADPKAMYKAFYFVDWPALNRHKAAWWGRVDLLVDAQRPDDPTFAEGPAVRAGLARAARTAFRARPWFEPGPWGGQWLKAHIPELPQDVPNYAWSFELITPENGLVFESGGLLLEVSFDSLMFQAHEAVLGEAAARFGFDFPIRFDYLDTVQGGNLSLQVHPRPGYMRAHFGEPFTQDETYYLLRAEPGAGVYLGLHAGADLDAFGRALTHSARTGAALDVDRFVQRHPARPHDLFLIPSGTLHCAGAGSVVLEISATPYIFTFKLYDWQRTGLDGQPRPLNLERALNNLVVDRRGDAVRRDLISAPVTLRAGADWRVVHLPTHPEHFYDVHRLEFLTELMVETDGSVQVLCVVAGGPVALESNGLTQPLQFAETVVVPAAAERYRLLNRGAGPAWVIRAFMKPAGSTG